MLDISMFLYLFIPPPSVDTKLPLSQCTVIRALSVLPPVGSPHASPLSSLCDTKLVKSTFCVGQGGSRAGAPLWLTGLVLSAPVALCKHSLWGLRAAATVVEGTMIPGGGS